MTRKERVKYNHDRMVKVNKTVRALKERESENIWRWCEVELIKTGEKVKIVRTGYGPAEYPEKDPHNILIDGVVVAECSNLFEVARWMLDRK